MNLSVWDKMMNGKNPNILVTAQGALAAKALNQRELALPDAMTFLKIIAILVPECSLTISATETSGGRLSALLAHTGLRPSMGKITRHATVFPIATLDPVRGYIKGLATMLTHAWYACFLHGPSITHFVARRKPKYFDIAVRRITDAQAQIRMPLAEAAK